MKRMSLYSSFFLSDSRPEQDRRLTDTLARDDAGHPQATHARKEQIQNCGIMVPASQRSHLFPGLPLALSLHTLAPEDCLLALNPGFLIFMPKGEFWVGAI